MSPLFHPIKNTSQNPLDLNSLLIENPTSTHFVRIQSNEFEDLGITKDDILIVDKLYTERAHALYIVIYEEEFTLMPSHSLPHTPIEYWGAVTHIIKKV